MTPYERDALVGQMQAVEVPTGHLLSKSGPSAEIAAQPGLEAELKPIELVGVIEDVMSPSGMLEMDP